MYSLELTGKWATAYADLNSIAQDLQTAREAFAWASDDASSPEHAPLFWQAGAISYRRAYTSGRPLVPGGYRQRLAIPHDLVDELFDADERAIHDRIIRHADKHVAHRVSDVEQAHVLLLLSNPHVGRSVDGVSDFTMRFSRPESDFLLRAARITDRLFGAISNVISELGDAIVSEMRKRDLDELYSGAHEMGA